MINQPVQLKAASDLFHPTADQKYPIGALYTDRDGGKYRYCKDSGTGITKALMAQSPVVTATLEDELQTAYGVAVNAVKFDCLVTTASGLADHDLIDGWMLVNQGSGAGDMYLIKDNIWTTSDTVLNIEIADTGGIRTAIAATDNITLVKNKYRDVVVAPTTKTGQPIGVPLVTVTASYYFWAKTKGPAPLLVDGSETLVVGDPCGEPETHDTAGAVGAMGAHTATEWGIVMYAAAAADYAIVDLKLEQ